MTKLNVNVNIELHQGENKRKNKIQLKKGVETSENLNSDQVSNNEIMAHILAIGELLTGVNNIDSEKYHKVVDTYRQIIKEKIRNT